MLFLNLSWFFHSQPCVVILCYLHFCDLRLLRRTESCYPDRDLPPQWGRWSHSWRTLHERRPGCRSRSPLLDGYRLPRDLGIDVRNLRAWTYCPLEEINPLRSPPTIDTTKQAGTAAETAPACFLYHQSSVSHSRYISKLPTQYTYSCPP